MAAIVAAMLILPMALFYGVGVASLLLYHPRSDLWTIESAGVFNAFAVHLWFGLSLVALAVARLRNARTLRWFVASTIAGMAWMGFFAVPDPAELVAGKAFVLGYAWPALVMAAIVLATCVERRSATPAIPSTVSS